MFRHCFETNAIKDSTMPIKLNSSMPIAASRFRRPTNRSSVGELLNSSHDSGSKLHQINATISHQYGTNRNELKYHVILMILQQTGRESQILYHTRVEQTELPVNLHKPVC